MNKIVNRKSIFSKRNPDFNKIFNIVQKIDEVNYLNSPILLNTYCYLTNFVKEYSEKWYNKSISKIKILDWGCGKGHNSFLLKKMGADIIACDLDLFDSKFFQNKYDIKVVKLNNEFDIPFENNSFDVVLSFGVLEHTKNDQRSLKEINRILKSNGLFFCFNLPYIMSWSQHISKIFGKDYHQKLYSRKQIEKMLTVNNFEILELWHRQLFPKNMLTNFKKFYPIEIIDQLLTEYSPLKYLATSLEFVAYKK